MYDRLPQDLIHQPEPGAKSGVQDIARQADREKGARLFFLAYEQEMNRLLLRLEWEERQFIFETNSDVSGELMGLLWDMPEHLSSFQRSKTLKPQASRSCPLCRSTLLSILFL